MPSESTSSVDDARPAEQPDAPTPLVTRYEFTVRIDMTASLTMELDGPDGEVVVEAELDARDIHGHITRHVPLNGPRASMRFLEADLDEWKPSNPDVVRRGRALHAEANSQYIHRASEWYHTYQDKALNADTGTPSVPAE